MAALCNPDSREPALTHSSGLASLRRIEREGETSQVGVLIRRRQQEKCSFLLRPAVTPLPVVHSLCSALTPPLTWRVGR